MRRRWMLVHRIVLQATLPVLLRLPYRLAVRLLGVMGRLDLLVVPGHARPATPAEAAAAVHRAARLLNAGLIVKMASDVRWPDARAVRTTFLGREEPFSTAWVNLAALTGAAVVPAFCRMDDDGRFDLVF